MSFPWGTLVDYIEFNKIRGWPNKYGIFMQALGTETFTVLILYGKEVTINSNIMEMFWILLDWRWRGVCRKEYWKIDWMGNKKR